MTRMPQIGDTPASASEETRNRKSQRSSMPWLGVGLGAGAAGAYGLSQGIASDAQSNRLSSAIANYSPRAFTHKELPPNQTGLTYYHNTMSPAAQLKPFGTPVGDAMVKVRSDPDIMESLGTLPYMLKTKAEQTGVSGAVHYRMFGNGPIPAYAHQAKAKFHNTPVPPALAPEGTRYSDWMGRKLEDFVAAETGQRTNPFEVDLAHMGHEDQKSLMERFHASLTPEEQKFRMTTEDPGPGYADQTSNYLPKAEALLKTRNLLKDVAIGGGGAAAGAVGGHMLYDIFRDKKDKNKHPWQRGLASLGGAGLGGAAAYFTGTERGQQMLADGLRNLKRRALGLASKSAAAGLPQPIPVTSGMGLAAGLRAVGGSTIPSLSPPSPKTAAAGPKTQLPAVSPGTGATTPPVAGPSAPPRPSLTSSEAANVARRIQAKGPVDELSNLNGRLGSMQAANKNRRQLTASQDSQHIAAMAQMRAMQAANKAKAKAKAKAPAPPSQRPRVPTGAAAPQRRATTPAPQPPMESTTAPPPPNPRPAPPPLPYSLPPPPPMEREFSPPPPPPPMESTFSPPPPPMEREFSPPPPMAKAGKAIAQAVAASVKRAAKGKKLKQGVTNTIGGTAKKRQVGPVTRGSKGKYIFHQKTGGGLKDDPIYDKYSRTKAAAERGRDAARIVCSDSVSTNNAETGCRI
jgi:hypothetical protein